MSDSEKEIYDALKLTDTDEKTESETAQNSSGLLENTAEKAEAISEKIADTDDVLKNAKNLVDSDSNAKETELTKNTENDELDLDEE